MRLLLSAFLLLLPGTLPPAASRSPGVARSHGSQPQAPGRWLWEGGQECECRDWLLKAPKRNPRAVLGPPRKQCPCDHVKGSERTSRHQKHRRKPQRPSRTCQQFLKRCQLASFALPL
ncbi:C-X-C motif chemokine 17 [Psammomys obesus]|uniref:C-X-C motif chemokine 17 n=1 Tax=Psammomys obesus TaxID=48139 RepID=UPI0024534411|nr:C-X-C motif chemokine 17 [Psammomys obesus]